MSVRVYELAKELSLDNKKMLEKITSLGIEAKSHMSVIEDRDAEKIKDEVLHGKSRDAKDDRALKTIIAPNGKPILQGRPMPKSAVPQKKAVSEEEEAVKVETGDSDKPAEADSVKNETKSAEKAAEKKAEKASETVPAPVKEKETEKPAVAEKTEEKPAEEVYVASTAGRQEFKIIKTNTEIMAKEAEEKAAREARQKKIQEENAARAQASGHSQGQDRGQRSQGQDRGPRPQGQDRGPRPQGQDRGPRPQGQDRGPRPQGQDRGPRPQGQDRGPRPQGQDRGPRPQGQDRGPRPQGQDRGPRPQGQDRGPRPQGQDRGPRPQGQDRGPRPQGQDRGPRPQGQDRGPRPGNRPGFKSDSKPSEAVVGMDKPSRSRKTNSKEPVKKDTNLKKPYKPLDLTKAAPKKHRKNRQDKAVDQVDETMLEMEQMPAGTKVITVPITVKGLSEQIERSTSQVIMALMKLGIMANVNQNIDEDTAVLLGTELGVNIVVGKVDEEVVEEGIEVFEDSDDDLKSRPPIITVMGHVDHGKTSLLDSIRKTSITDKEAGGITQHIGASEVTLNGQRIVFLDTPGHEAFTAMRARGAHVTDIAILVVAADDSVKPQTIESISHAKAAGVPIIVAVNKMDKPGADPDRVKKDLTEHGILVEEWGGDTICVPVSAKTGEGIVNLLEMILLQAEVLELKANPSRLAMGTVIEARLDKAKGPVATLLVLNGTLKAGMSVVAGTSSGRIRAMTNFKGDTIAKAGPATAVEILGLTEVPEAGDEFNAVKEDKIAREIAEKRRIKLREEVMVKNSSVTLEQLFSQIEEGEVKELNLIIKADVQGSVGALTSSLEKLKNENVIVKIIHTGVGTVTESDVMLASTSNAIIIGFNVRPSTAVTTMADRNGVEIRTYRIIYEAIEDIEAAMKGMLDPVFKEVVMGKIEVRETFKVPGIGIIAGAYVLEGRVQRNAQIRLVRDGIVIHEGKISSLKRFKDDAKEVNTGYECGIGIENYNDLKEGDIIEAFKMEEVERK